MKKFGLKRNHIALAELNTKAQCKTSQQSLSSKTACHLILCPDIHLQDQDADKLYHNIWVEVLATQAAPPLRFVIQLLDVIHIKSRLYIDGRDANRKLHRPCYKGLVKEWQQT